MKIIKIIIITVQCYEVMGVEHMLEQWQPVTSTVIYYREQTGSLQ